MACKVILCHCHCSHQCCPLHKWSLQHPQLSASFLVKAKYTSLEVRRKIDPLWRSERQLFSFFTFLVTDRECAIKSRPALWITTKSNSHILYNVLCLWLLNVPCAVRLALAVSTGGTDDFGGSLCLTRRVDASFR